MTVTPLLRQFTVAASAQFAAFSVGGAVTYPTLLMEQFRANGTSIQLDMDTRSWIGSIYGLAGIPSILMPIITQKIGRKFGYMISCLFLITGWILAYTAKSAAEILISESFHGLGTNSLMPVAFLSLSEMLAPKYRYVSMQIFAMVQIAGMAVCGILGRYLHYRTVSLVMLASMCMAVALATIWPESPSWFACQGKFKQCEKAFLYLRGEDENSNKELRELIAAQKENLSQVEAKSTVTMRGLWTKITSRDFYMPTFHTFILLNMLYWSGSDVILIYFIEIVAKTINDPNATLYAGIVMYIIFFAGSLVTTILVANYNNKTILLCNACGIITCLSCAFVVTTLQSFGLLAKDSYLFMYCLIGFIACNGLSTVYLIAAEIMPVRHRNIGGALYIVFNCTLYASTLKLSPYLFVHIGLSGTFLIYTVNAVWTTLFVWRYVPETKGRTLQEIEDFYQNGRFIQRNVDNADTSMRP